jgi:hypothetical protein
MGFTSLNIKPAWSVVEWTTTALAWNVSLGLVPILRRTTEPTRGGLGTLRQQPCDPKSATHELDRVPEVSSTSSAGAMNWYRGTRRRS